MTLTWDDLRQWAGAKILGRGKSYLSNVFDLSRTDDGGWVAWVSGTDDYATLVEMDEKGEIDWQCTCPYDWGPCKHAVAVVLAGLEQVKAGRELPLLDEESELYLSLWGDDSEYDDDLDEAQWETGEKESGTKANDSEVEKILKKKKKDELAGLLADLAVRYPEVRRRILEDDQLDGGQIDKLVRSLRGEIKQVTEEDAWCNHWNNEGNLPDYSHIRQQLGALLDKGHADAVVGLGDELWERGSEQVGQSHDDGYTAGEIYDCMKIVFKAIAVSSLTPPEQLLKMIGIFLADEYSICDSLGTIIQRKEYTKKHWQEVGEQFDKRLAAMPKPKGDDFSGRYRRERLMAWLIEAHERSGQEKKITPLLEKEVGITHCYERLVSKLIQSNDTGRARSWCIKGFQATIEDAPGIAHNLQQTLRKLAEGEKNLELVAAFRAEDFFDRPCLNAYVELHKAAEKIKVWPEVREAVLHFLASGERPGLTVGGAKKKKWPLPPPEVMAKPRRGVIREKYPDFDTLIEIAILEKRLDDVVQLYQKQMKTLRWGIGMGEKVAGAVAATHPDISLDIWKRIAISKINLVKPKEYENAAVYLRKMRKVYQKTKRTDEWRELLTDLRTEHKAKRRLMEVLDSLEGKKIID